MMRGVMESVYRPERLDDIFERHAKVQYQREQQFSTLVNLLSLVVCGIHPLIAMAEQLNILANQVNLKRFRKQPRKSKKKKKKPLVHDPKRPHVATARLLSDQ